VIDPARPILDEGGEHIDLEEGYRLAWAVEADGSRSLWLMASVCEEEATHGTLDDAPHEHEGPMPPAVRERLFGDLRCGAPTNNGRPCRHKVTHLGESCAAHSTRSAR